VGVQYDSKRDRFVVRWREDGSKRCRPFSTPEEAEAFDVTLHQRPGRPSVPAPPSVGRPPASSRGDGIYPYQTAQGRRWRFVFRHADGRTSSRRGFNEPPRCHNRAAEAVGQARTRDVRLVLDEAGE
jgi:hypothetical protein